MFWAVVLPFQITCVLLAIAVLLGTLYARILGKSATTRFRTSSGLAFLLFIPSCTGVMFTVDQFRFGTFHYNSYDQVNDYHVEFCLPQKATDITVHKDGAGHLARYTITENDLRDFLDATWRDRGEYAAVPREELSDEGRIVREEEYRKYVERLKWRPLKDAIKLSGPRSARGAGANYFFEPSTNTVYHDAGYW